MKQALIIGGLSLTLLLAGCTTVPIDNGQHHALPTNMTHTQPTSEAVETAILRAGSSIGWRMQPQANDQIQATMTQGSQSATVLIDYGVQGYKIQYHHSQGLRYNGDQIDPLYNEWVENLNNAIVNGLASL